MADRRPRPTPIRRCGECGHDARISVRASDGEQDLCAKCARNEPARCALCSELRRCYYARTNYPVCRRCAPTPTPPCSHCAKRRRIAALTGRGPVCADCQRAAARGRPRCQHCRRSRRPAAILDGAPLCAACAGTRTRQRCSDCDREGRNWSDGRCPACALTAELAVLRARGHPDAVARLEPLLAQLAGHEKPTTALAWLQHSPAAPTLRDLLAGEIALTHEALDAHDVGQATAYLRSWLVGHAILPAREERVARFERWSSRALAALGEHPDRTHVTAYARWKLRPELARRLASRHARPSSHKASYLKLRTAIRLAGWLHERGRTLGQLNQPLLDDWLAERPSRALPTRDFLDWTHHAGLLGALHIRRPAAAARRTPIDDARRLRQARALLDDHQLEPAARVAGCLVLLYGQRVTRIVELRRHDVIDQGARLLLRLGDEPIDVAEPIAGLLRHLHAHSSGPWLLPGAKPGTHIGPERIRRRLRELGIRPEQARPAALLALAASVPAPILAELLGYCDDTANHWRRAAGGDWARYASLAATPTT